MNEARYRIGTLARLTGVTTHAIRIWERRYGALAPSRTAGGARLYTDADVHRLRLVKKLLELGYTISAVAKLDMAELSRLSPADAAPSPSSTPRVSDTDSRARVVIDQILAAVSDLDLERAGRALLQATTAFSPHDLVTHVLSPVLNEVGERWASGEMCIASEHAASALLRTHLGALLAAQPVNGLPAVVCTTPAGEQHELGALMAAVILAMHGRRAIFLGANLGTQQIVEAVRLSKAGSLALSLVGLNVEDARREVEALCKALPPGVQLLVGGRRVAELPGLPKRVRVLASLAELEGWLRTAPN